MLRLALRRASSSRVLNPSRFVSGSASSPSLSIWRRKKEIGKEGLVAAKELKRLQSDPVRLDRFIRSQVSRLLKSDLVAVLAEFQRQDQVFLCIKVRASVFFFHSLFLCFSTHRWKLNPFSEGYIFSISCDEKVK